MEAVGYKDVTKIGRGGFGCRCCNPWYNTKKHGKSITHRWVRRKNKQADNEVEAEQEGAGTREDFRSRG